MSTQSFAYAQVREALTKQITEQQLTGSLPSERELCATFDIARSTLRQALGQLENMGLIYRKNRSGWYVCPRKLKYDPIIVSVDARGLYFVERGEEQPKAMTLADVTDYAAKIFRQVPTAKVLIRGDEQVGYGKVVALMGGLQAAGITQVGLITEAPDPQAQP